MYTVADKRDKGGEKQLLKCLLSTGKMLETIMRDCVWLNPKDGNKEGRHLHRRIQMSLLGTDEGRDDAAEMENLNC